MKKILATLLILILSLGSLSNTEAATIKISKKKITLEVGKSTTLYITGTKNKIKWSSSNKKVATVSAKGKVAAKKQGASTITATVNKENYKCKVTVIENKNTQENNSGKNNNKDSNNKEDNNNDKEYIEIEYAKEVVRLINIEREKEGLLPLSDADISLNEAAKIRAKELVTSFSHSRPDGDSCFTALDEMDVSYSWAGENIASGYKTPKEVVKGWMNSEGHRDNIMNDNFSNLGVGVYYYNNKFYWVQLFIG